MKQRRGASVKRKTEYVLRSIMPPAVRELQRALAVTRRTGGARAAGDVA